MESAEQIRNVPAQKVVDFKDLVIWKKAMALTTRVYQLTARFPSEEKFGLTSQMRRAAVSVPSNIAEGQGRRGAGEFPQFLSLARGSLAELETQLVLSANLGFAEPLEIVPLTSDILEIQKMIAGIQRKLALRQRTVRSGEVVA